VRLVTHASLAHPPPRAFGTIPLIPTGWSAITAYDFLGTPCRQPCRRKCIGPRQRLRQTDLSGVSS
jgi:hypothetical protein